MEGEGEKKRDEAKDGRKLGEKGGRERRSENSGSGSHCMDFKETKNEKRECDTRNNRGVSVVFVQVPEKGDIIRREEEKEGGKGEDGERGRGGGGGKRGGEPSGVDVTGGGKREKNKGVTSGGEPREGVVEGRMGGMGRRGRGGGRGGRMLFGSLGKGREARRSGGGGGRRRRRGGGGGGEGDFEVKRKEKEKRGVERGKGEVGEGDDITSFFPDNVGEVIFEDLPSHRKEREERGENNSKRRGDEREGGEVEEDGDGEGEGIEEGEEGGDAEGGEGREGGKGGEGGFNGEGGEEIAKEEGEEEIDKEEEVRRGRKRRRRRRNRRRRRRRRRPPSSQRRHRQRPNQKKKDNE